MSGLVISCAFTNSQSFNLLAQIREHCAFLREDSFYESVVFELDLLLLFFAVTISETPLGLYFLKILLFEMEVRSYVDNFTVDGLVFGIEGFVLLLSAPSASANSVLISYFTDVAGMFDLLF